MYYEQYHGYILETRRGARGGQNLKFMTRFEGDWFYGHSRRKLGTVLYTMNSLKIIHGKHTNSDITIRDQTIRDQTFRDTFNSCIR